MNRKTENEAALLRTRLIEKIGTLAGGWSAAAALRYRDGQWERTTNHFVSHGESRASHIMTRRRRDDL
jgi:hypothetical protein